MTLPDRYDTQVVALEHIPDENLTLEMVKQFLEPARNGHDDEERLGDWSQL